MTKVGAPGILDGHRIHAAELKTDISAPKPRHEVLGAQGAKETAIDLTSKLPSEAIGVLATSTLEIVGPLVDEVVII